MMPKKMRTMREVTETYYRNSDGDYIKKDKWSEGKEYWFVEIDGEITGMYKTKEAAFKGFAKVVEK